MSTSSTQACMADSCSEILYAEKSTMLSRLVLILVVSYVLPASRQANDVTIMMATRKTTTSRKKIVNCLVLTIETPPLLNSPCLFLSPAVLGWGLWDQ